jgi:tetratricopeptide (TPR) repeat protein
MLVELLLERGELGEAESELNEVLQHDPGDARALLDRGRLHIARARWQEAERDLMESIKRSPDVKVSHLLLATVSARLGNPTAAAREAELARNLPESERWPDPFVEEISSLGMGRSVLLERASMLLSGNHIKEAITTLNAAAAQYPDNADVWMRLGDAYRQDGQWRQAESAFRKGIAKRPESSEAQLALAEALVAQQRFADALPALKEAVRLNANLPETHYRLGECLLKLGDREGAIGAFTESIHVEPSFRNGYIGLGRVLKEAGRPLDAAAQFRRALEIDAQDPLTVELLKQAESAARGGSGTP